MIHLDLAQEQNLKKIKLVCEVATKEYTVQQTLEKIEFEMKSCEFKFDTTQDGLNLYITNIQQVINLYEELYLRIMVLKTNPNIKNFVEKVMEIEKIIRTAVDLIYEWDMFQKNFIYLNNIFQLDEIQKALQLEARLFSQITTLYGQTCLSFQQVPQVYKLS